MITQSDRIQELKTALATYPKNVAIAMHLKKVTALDAQGFEQYLIAEKAAADRRAAAAIVMTRAMAR